MAWLPGQQGTAHSLHGLSCRRVQQRPAAADDEGHAMWPASQHSRQVAGHGCRGDYPQSVMTPAHWAAHRVAPGVPGVQVPTSCHQLLGHVLLAIIGDPAASEQLTA